MNYQERDPVAVAETNGAVATLHEIAPAPLPAASPPEAAAHRQPFMRRAGRIACGLAWRAAVLLPFAAAAGIDTLAVAPPAHTSADIAGAQVSAKVDVGTNAENVDLQALTLHTKGHTSFLGKSIGANVKFAFNDVSLTDANGQFDLKKAEQLVNQFSDPKPAEDEVTSAIEWHYGLWCGSAAAATFLAGGGVMLGRRLRQRKLREYTPEEYATVQADRKWIRYAGRAALVATSAGLLVPAAAIMAMPNHTAPIHADSALNGTVLQGVGVSGLATPVINVLMPEVTSYITEKDNFYNAEEHSFMQSFLATYHTKQLPKQPGVKRIIFEDDIQGTDGPQAIVGDAAQAYNADLVVIGGDITATGSSYETLSLDTLQDHAGKVPVFLNLGHHDSSAVATMARQRGITVADGKEHDINGITIAGVNAPDNIPFGGTDNMTAGQIDAANQKLTEKLITDSCDAKKKLFIVTAHDYNAIGNTASEYGCASTGLFGRSYLPEGPYTYPNGTTEFVSGSTGGHGADSGAELFNLIHNPAYFYEIDINSSTGKVLDYKLITMDAAPATGVTIGASTKPPAPSTATPPPPSS